MKTTKTKFQDLHISVLHRLILIVNIIKKSVSRQIRWSRVRQGGLRLVKAQSIAKHLRANSKFPPTQSCPRRSGSNCNCIFVQIVKRSQLQNVVLQMKTLLFKLQFSFPDWLKVFLQIAKRIFLYYKQFYSNCKIYLAKLLATQNCTKIYDCRWDIERSIYRAWSKGRGKVHLRNNN